MTRRAVVQWCDDHAEILVAVSGGVATFLWLVVAVMCLLLLTGRVH